MDRGSRWPRDLLPPGVEVEVRRRYDSEWAPGFSVHDICGSSYVIRRQSDGAVLPGAFSAEDVRVRDRRPS